MASVTEMFDSRTGRQFGVHGSKPCELAYRVTVDAVGDDPVLMIRTPGITGAKPIGTPHPHDAHLTVHNYRIMRRINTLNWEVNAVYQIPRAAMTIHPADDEWEFSLQSSTESAKLITELVDPVKDKGGIGKVIGYPHFRVADLTAAPPETPTHWAKPDPNKPATGLIQTGQRVSEPFEAGNPVISFALTKQLANINTDNIGTSLTYLRAVNYGVFQYVAAAPRTVRFEFISVQTREGEVNGASDNGVIYDVRLEFIFNANEWTPHKRRVVWEPDGDHRVVSGVYVDAACTDNPLIEESKVFWQMNLDEILALYPG